MRATITAKTGFFFATLLSATLLLPMARATPLGERIGCETTPLPVFDEKAAGHLLYRATAGGLEVLDEQTGARRVWTACDGLPGTHIAAVEPAATPGVVFLAPRGTGVWRLDTRSAELRRVAPQLDSLRWVTSLERHAEVLYAGTVQHGLWSLSLSGDGEPPKQPLRRFRERRVSDLATASDDGALLIARDLGGLWRWKPGTKEHRVLKGSVQRLEREPDGGIVVNRGLERCRVAPKRRCRPLPSAPPGLPGGPQINHVTSLCTHSLDGDRPTLIAGTYDQGIYRRADQQWTQLSAEGPAPRFVNQVLSAGDELWVATPVGAFRLLDGRWKRFGEPSGLPSDHVNALHVDSAGRVLFATSAGLAILQAGRVTQYTEATGLPHRIVYGVTSRDDRIVVGTAHGLAIQQGGIWRQWSRERGGLADNWVNAVALTQSGQVLAGTYDQGIDRLHGERFLSETAAESLWVNPNGILAVGELPGSFAFTLGDGLWWRDEAAPWQCIARAAALPSDDVTAAAVLDGQIFVGTRNGLAVFATR